MHTCLGGICHIPNNDMWIYFEMWVSFSFCQYQSSFELYYFCLCLFVQYWALYFLQHVFSHKRALLPVFSRLCCKNSIEMAFYLSGKMNGFGVIQLNNFSHWGQGEAFSLECTFWWALTSPLDLKDFRHSSHGNGFSFEWTCDQCLFKSLVETNDLSQSLQPYGFSPECIILWFLRLVEWINVLSQSLQIKVLFSWKLLKCPRRAFFVYVLSHTEHANNLLSLWIDVWLFNSGWDLNSFEHWKHVYGFSPVCVLMWICCKKLFWKVLPQTSQENGLSFSCTSWMCSWRFDFNLYALLHFEQLFCFNCPCARCMCSFSFDLNL